MFSSWFRQPVKLARKIVLEQLEERIVLDAAIGASPKITRLTIRLTTRISTRTNRPMPIPALREMETIPPIS